MSDGNNSKITFVDGKLVFPEQYPEYYQEAVVQVGVETFVRTEKGFVKVERETEDFESYLQEVLKTESCDEAAILKRLSQPGMIRMFHAAFGNATEAGELLDMVKKHLFYGKPLDLVNLEEELGDLEWYETLLIYAMRTMNYDISRNSIRKKNVAKLRARYNKGKFTEQDAVERNIEVEREILERK